MSKAKIQAAVRDGRGIKKRIADATRLKLNIDFRRIYGVHTMRYRMAGRAGHHTIGSSNVFNRSVYIRHSF